jgi:hypothetical protein
MSTRNLPGAQNDWAVVATLLDLPADYDYALILPEFVNSFLQPVFEQATDLYELTLEWDENHETFAPGAVRRLTHTGDDGWVIPEFALDPSGRRLLWTQNKFGNAVRVDRACVMRQLRDAFVGRLRGIETIAQLPFGIVPEMRDAAADLLRDPTTYPVKGTACGGTDPKQPATLESQTLIGHFEK